METIRRQLDADDDWTMLLIFFRLVAETDEAPLQVSRRQLTRIAARQPGRDIGLYQHAAVAWARERLITDGFSEGEVGGARNGIEMCE